MVSRQPTQLYDYMGRPILVTPRAINSIECEDGSGRAFNLTTTQGHIIFIRFPR